MEEVAVWLGVKGEVNLEGTHHFWSFGRDFKERNNNNNKLNFVFWMATMWIIWKERNSLISEGILDDIFSVINKIEHISWGWFMGKVDTYCGGTIIDRWKSPMSCNVLTKQNS